MIHSVLLTVAVSMAPQDQLMSPELLWDLHRLGSPTLSADGTQVAYSVRDYTLEENSGRSSIYVVDVATSKSRLLLEGWRGAGELQFAKTPFGERIVFAGRPDVDGVSTQAWSLNAADGSVKQLSLIHI